MKFIYKITILTFLIPLITFGSIDKEKHEKTKIISKEYSVNADAKVAINNKYGDLNITSWNKNRVEIEVQITVKGDDLDEVESKLEAIQINFNTMRFGTVRNRLTIDTDYGSLTIKYLKNTFDKVDINAQYTGIRIGVENGINFDFEIDL